MLSSFIFSNEGNLFLDEFIKKFDCRFRIDEPGGDLVFDAGEKTYKISDDETLEKFKELVLESVKTEKNLLSKKYKVVKYKKSVDY